MRGRYLNFRITKGDNTITNVIPEAVAYDRIDCGIRRSGEGFLVVNHHQIRGCGTLILNHTAYIDTKWARNGYEANHVT